MTDKNTADKHAIDNNVAQGMITSGFLRIFGFRP